MTKIEPARRELERREGRHRPRRVAVADDQSAAWRSTPSDAAQLAAPTPSSTTCTPLPSGQRAHLGGERVHRAGRGHDRRPRPWPSAAFSALPAWAITVAPIALSQGTRIEPTPPAAAWTSTVWPGWTLAQRSISIFGGAALEQRRRGDLGADAVGQLHRAVGGDQPVGGVGAERAGESSRSGRPREIRRRLRRPPRRSPPPRCRAPRGAAPGRGRSGDRCR